MYFVGGAWMFNTFRKLNVCIHPQCLIGSRSAYRPGPNGDRREWLGLGDTAQGSTKFGIKQLHRLSVGVNTILYARA